MARKGGDIACRGEGLTWGMLGYIFMILAVVVLLPLVLFLLGRGRGPRPSGKDGFAPVSERRQPAADEPTPGVDTPRDPDGRSAVPPA
ncbi:MAG: hypothetical protein C0518_13305 [Opitutus sp.]|nr:hypothetical protein [Opitutus sp.]